MFVIFSEMKNSRRQYQREWIKKKRLALSAKKETLPVDLSASDVSDDELVPTLNAVTSLSHHFNLDEPSSSSHMSDSLLVLPHLHSENVGSFTASPYSSCDSDGAVSSEDDCWDTLDMKCNAYLSSDSDDEPSETNLKSKLQAWAVQCNVTHSQLDRLLPILKQLDHTLPACAKTLLKKDSSARTELLSGEAYIYTLVF